MKGIPHHICGEHVWPIGRCCHGPMDALERVPKAELDKKRNADTLRELLHILFNKRSVDRIPHLLEHR